MYQSYLFKDVLAGPYSGKFHSLITVAVVILKLSIAVTALCLFEFIEE